MVPEWIDDSPYTPTVLVADGPNNCRSCRDNPIENDIRISHNHQYPHRTTAERLGAEVEVLWRLVGQPEFSSARGQPSDHLPLIVVDSEQLGSSERRLGALDRRTF